MTRADKSESSSDVKQLSGTMEVKYDEIPNLSIDNVIAKYDVMILDMVRQQTSSALETLSAEIPTAQTIDAKGKKLNAEIVLDMLEAIQIDFYPDGRPHELHVVGGLITAEALQLADEQCRNDPKLQLRHDNLMARKKEEWRAREADRKLVG